MEDLRTNPILTLWRTTGLFVMNLYTHKVHSQKIRSRDVCWYETISKYERTNLVVCRGWQFQISIILSFFMCQPWIFHFFLGPSKAVRRGPYKSSVHKQLVLDLRWEFQCSITSLDMEHYCILNMDYSAETQWRTHSNPLNPHTAHI